MARVIVFGLKDFASLAHYYLQHDSPHEVVAFTVTRDHLPAEPTFEGKPVVPFEELEQRYPPGEFHFFAPMSPHGMNCVREGVFLQARARGYRCLSYVSSRAKIYANVPVGENCFILDDNTVQPFCRIGDNVVLWARNGIGHHSAIGDHCFLTGNVIVPGHCVVGPSCFLGVSSTLRDGLTLAEGTLLAMGSCLTQDTTPWGVYKGNPARKYRMKSTEVRL
jgi:sugar O-acyltransferase (sialic acid O-acetyltransferase NeuD family)